MKRCLRIVAAILAITMILGIVAAFALGPPGARARAAAYGQKATAPAPAPCTAAPVPTTVPREPVTNEPFTPITQFAGSRRVPVLTYPMLA